MTTENKIKNTLRAELAIIGIYYTWEEMWENTHPGFRKGWEAFQMRTKEDVVRANARAFFIDRAGYPWYYTVSQEGIKFLHKLETISILSDASFQLVNISAEPGESQPSTMIFLGEFTNDREFAAQVSKIFTNLYFYKS